MRQNELMVGDWVKLDFYDVPYGDEEESVWKNGKITAIHHGNWVDVNFGGPLAECDIEVEDIQPIPLTEEILKKNGFKDGQYFAELYIQGWHVISDARNLCMESERGWHMNIPCRYVHELQHALRILKIEREIEL